MEWVDEGKIDFSSFGRFISLAEPNGKPRIYPIPKLLYKPSQTKVVLNFKCVVTQKSQNLGRYCDFTPTTRDRLAIGPPENSKVQKRQGFTYVIGQGRSTFP